VSAGPSRRAAFSAAAGLVLGLAAAALLLPGPALADGRPQSTTVIGGSYAKDCEHAAKLGLSGDGMEACDNALSFEALSSKDRAGTYVNRGILFNKRLYAEKAFADFDAAFKLVPDLPEAFLNRGNTHFLVRRTDLALKDYQRSIDLGVKDLAAAYYNRGLAYEAQGKMRDAMADFAKASELAPEWELPKKRLAR